MVTEKEIWALLEEIPDPEVPVLSIVDLGIVRAVRIQNTVEIDITPTYSGCPAMGVIEENIYTELRKKGVENLTVKTILSPAWTTDWLSEEGRRKLKEYGIAPPENEIDKSILFAKPIVVPCPNCDSRETEMVSEFGSTACKAHYVCKACREPFDYFKCLR